MVVLIPVPCIPQQEYHCRSELGQLWDANTDLCFCFPWQHAAGSGCPDPGVLRGRCWRSRVHWHWGKFYGGQSGGHCSCLCAALPPYCWGSARRGYVAKSFHSGGGKEGVKQVSRRLQCYFWSMCWQLFHLCVSNPELHLCLEHTELGYFKKNYFSAWWFCGHFDLGDFRWHVRLWCLPFFLSSFLSFFPIFCHLNDHICITLLIIFASVEQNWVFCLKAQEQVGEAKRNSRILWGNVAAEGPQSKTIAGIQLLHKVNIARLLWIRVLFSKSSVSWG